MHEKILILDFGAQYTQLIARRVREAACTARSIPSTSATRSSASSRPRASFSPAASRLTEEATRARRSGLRVWACRCWASATACRPWPAARRRGRSGPVREFGYAEVRARGHTAAVRGHPGFPHAGGPRPARGVDEPRRQGRRVPPGFKMMASTKLLPDRGHGRRKPPAVRRAVPSRGHPYRCRARRSWSASCGYLRLRADWNMPDFAAEAMGRIRDQVGADEVILGLSGGVDSSVAAALIHRAIGDQLTLRIRRHRPAAAQRGRAGDGDLRRQPRRQGDPRRCGAQFMGRLEGVAGSGAKAQDHRPRVRRGVPARGGQGHERQMAGAGHDLPGRHRVGRRQDQEGRHRSSRTTTSADCPRRCT